MCSGHRTDSPPVETGENSDGKCSTFGRVCSGAKLVEEDERMFIDLFEERNDIRHMGREGTETLLNTLFIADIGVYFCKDGKFGPVKRRNVKTCLTHEGKQPGCL